MTEENLVILKGAVLIKEIVFPFVIPQGAIATEGIP